MIGNLMMQVCYVERVSIRGYERIIHLYPDMSSEPTPNFVYTDESGISPITERDIITYDLSDEEINGMVMLYWSGN